MIIDKNFEGGNIQVIKITDTDVELAVEIRDTVEDWFYWAFHITDAAGKKVHFHFQDGKRIGYFGAAVSHDLIHWEWTGNQDNDYQGFSYSFKTDENEAWFCHDLRYSTAMFDMLCNELNLKKQILTISEKGRPVPYVEFGSGKNVLLLTSRHHSCESTGTYVKEGMIRELILNPIPDFTVIAIPFVDLDGVVDGDQGKSRNGHDHNNDYKEGRYASIRAIKELGNKRNIVFVQDLHSPWHFSGWHDHIHSPRKPLLTNTATRMGELFTACCKSHPEALQYDTIHDLPYGVDWNNKPIVPPGTSCSVYFALRDGVKYSQCYETPYFGVPNNIVTQKGLFTEGTSLAEAFRLLASEFIL